MCPRARWAPYDKNAIYGRLDEFVAGVEAFRREEGIRYDLIHAHYWLSGVAGEKLAQRWGVPLTQMFHTLGQMKNDVAKAPRDREIALRIEEETRLVDVADRIIAPTSTERAQLAWYYGADPEKISVIPCGVDTRLFRPRDQEAARHRLNLPGGRLLLFVGRIERLKGIDTLLEATALLVARPGYEDLRVLIVGGDLESTTDNPEQQRVRQLACDLGVAGRVDFLGAQSQAELAYFYAAADLTIMPSHYESFGMVALEFDGLRHAGGRLARRRPGAAGERRRNRHPRARGGAYDAGDANARDPAGRHGATGHGGTSGGLR